MISLLILIACFGLFYVWLRHVLYKGADTVSLMKSTIKLPAYKKDYEAAKELCEKFNGPNSWKRQPGDGIKLFRLHLKINTIAFYILLFLAGYSIHYPSATLYFVFCSFVAIYAAHVIYINHYNKANRKAFEDYLNK